MIVITWPGGVDQEGRPLINPENDRAAIAMQAEIAASLPKVDNAKSHLNNARSIAGLLRIAVEQSPSVNADIGKVIVDGLDGIDSLILRAMGLIP